MNQYYALYCFVACLVELTPFLLCDTRYLPLCNKYCFNFYFSDKMESANGQTSSKKYRRFDKRVIISVAPVNIATIKYCKFCYVKKFSHIGLKMTPL